MTKKNTARKDIEAVTQLLKRPPQGNFEVVLRCEKTGEPRVLRNAPLLYDGTPMPTLYWLVGEEDCKKVSRLESAGGVKLAERAIPAKEIMWAHKLYAEQRDQLLPKALRKDRSRPLPTGGVGGTARGVKCLHAHYAWYLVGGKDPVGKWVAEQLESSVKQETVQSQKTLPPRTSGLENMLNLDDT